MDNLYAPNGLPNPPVIHQLSLLSDPSAECYRHTVKTPETQCTLFYRPGTAYPSEEEWMLHAVVRFEKGYTLDDWEPVFGVLFRGETLPAKEWYYSSATVNAFIRDVRALGWRGDPETWSDEEYRKRMGFGREELEGAWVERARAG